MVDYFTSEEQWDTKIYIMTMIPRGGSAFLTQMEDLDLIKATGFRDICMTPIFHCVPEYLWHYDPDPCKIVDHRELNSDLGTMEEFLRLVDEAHQRGMKVILQVVMASLVKSSVLFNEHPEYFTYQEKKREPFHLEDLLKLYDVTYEEFVEETALTEEDFNGDYGDPDWDKNVPLNYGDGNSGLWDYQEETLRMWAKYVDGFSCIAAPKVPMKFWKRVQKTISREKPDFLWILMDIERRETLWDYMEEWDYTQEW